MLQACLVVLQKTTKNHSFSVAPILSLRSLSVVILGLLLSVGSLIPDPLIARDLRVLSRQRWLEVRQLRGSVTFQGPRVRRSARIGDRLLAVRQGITTGKRSSATLAIDTHIGTVNLSENTSIQVKSLSVHPSGGRVTILSIARGQARLRVRPFNNHGSKLEIHTPSGVAGVRGTVFGVSVDSEGKTGIYTLMGAVEAQAQQKSVLIKGGEAAIIQPEEPPTVPESKPENQQFDVQSVSRIGTNKARLTAKVDPLNIVLINDELLETDREGKLDAVVPLPVTRQLRVVVRTPLGKEHVYVQVVP